MVQGPPLSDSEPDIQEYQYESDGEEILGNSAHALFQEAGGNYRCKWSSKLREPCFTCLQVAQAALLAYTW